MLEYYCDDCWEELTGDFGEPVFCEKCGKTWETDWDYNDVGDPMCWIVKEIQDENNKNIKRTD